MSVETMRGRREVGRKVDGSPERLPQPAAALPPEEKESRIRQHAAYVQRMGEIRALRESAPADDAAHALDERTLHASEIAQQITPDIVRELARRYAPLAGKVGEDGPNSLTHKLQAAVRALATSDPEELENVTRGFEALKGYMEGAYKNEIAEVTAACQKDGIGLDAFSHILNTSPDYEQVRELTTEIHIGYTPLKQFARILSFGLFGLIFSARRKANKLIQQYAPKYTAAESRLDQLCREFGSTLDMDRIAEARGAV